MHVFHRPTRHGETAFLIELAEQAEQLDYVAVRATAYKDMPDEIIETPNDRGQSISKIEKMFRASRPAPLAFLSDLPSRPPRKRCRKDSMWETHSCNHIAPALSTRGS